MVSNVEGTGNPIRAIRETMGQQFYPAELGKETGTKGPSGVREKPESLATKNNPTKETRQWSNLCPKTL